MDEDEDDWEWWDEDDKYCPACKIELDYINGDWYCLSCEPRDPTIPAQYLPPNEGELISNDSI